MEQEFKYYAFISYSSKDTAWGRRVQRKLEGYRMPATLCRQRGWKRRPISPIFFAPTDIQPGGLDNELQQRLRASRNLIVICSPRSARSTWVGQEIEYFNGLGRADSIHFFIVDGVPHSGDPATECFHPVLEQLGMPEILAANIHEHNYRWPWLNRERAYVQLISKLLGVEFDAIWRRHRRRLVQKLIGLGVALLVVLAAVWAAWHASQPFEAQVTLAEATAHNGHLPPLRDAVVTITLDNETKADTLAGIDGRVTFANIPRRLLGKPARLTVACRDFVTVDTTVALGRDITLNVNRDPATYGHLRFAVWRDGHPVEGVRLAIGGRQVTSGAGGLVELNIPLAGQRTAYPVVADVPLLDDTLHAPCGQDDIIRLR